MIVLVTAVSRNVCVEYYLGVFITGPVNHDCDDRVLACESITV
jgi:hypothetical protein